MAIAPTNPDDPQKPPPSYEDFQRDYWAPDREQVLASMAPKPPDAPSVSAPTPAPSSGGYQPPTGGISGYGSTPPPAPAPAPATSGTSLPGDPNLPGYGDMSTSNPWRDSLTYQQIMQISQSGASPTTGINGGGGMPQVGSAGATTPVPAGFDATKWNDPTKSDPKYDIGHIVASGGTNEQVQALLAQKYPGWSLVGTDKIQDPQGNIFDFRFDQEGANRPMWEGVGGPGFPAAGATGSTSGTIGGQVSGAATGGAPQNSAFSDQVRQILLGQLGGLTGPVTSNDPAIKAEMDAQTAGADRLRREQRAADAERQAMNGLLNGGQSSGAFEQNVASGFEGEQQQLSGVRAQLFTREIQSRRQQVAQLLAQAMQSGDQESQRNLQYQLALMDDALRRLGLAQNQSQFNDTFGLEAGRFQYQKDRDLAQYGAGY